MSPQLARAQLYGILDLGYVAPAEAGRAAAAMIAGGVQLLQLRAKHHPPDELIELARQIHRITSVTGVPLVINDHPQLAREIDAEGVHVGQGDMSITEARAIAGGGCFVGRSTHALEQAVRAAEEGADYIGFGPLFATPTKPDYAPIGVAEIGQVHAVVSVPIFCIGGITLDNLPKVIAAGARRVVMVSGLLLAPDIAEYARATRSLLDAQS